MMTGWRSWTSSPFLQLLLLDHHLPQNCQLQSIIYSTQVPSRILFFSSDKQRKGGRDREPESGVQSFRLSVFQGLRSNFHILAKQMKNERDKYNRVPIHHAVSLSVSVFGSLIMSEWLERGSVYKIKLFDLLRWPRSPTSAFVSISPITNHLRKRQSDSYRPK